jgi:polar amino acid transport system substrate-binding protein
MRTRVLAVALLGLSMITALSSCGQSEPPAPTPTAPPVTAPPPGTSLEPPGGSVELDGSPTIEKIKKRGELMVGLRSDAPMFAMRDEKGDYRGFDVEIARIVARGLGLDPRVQVTFRWLPPPLRVDAITAGNIDMQLGGFNPASPNMTKVGPYAVTRAPGTESEHFIGLKPGDDAMRAELQRILDASVADGSWQRAYDSTLGAAGVQARPAPR